MSDLTPCRQAALVLSLLPAAGYRERLAFMAAGLSLEEARTLTVSQWRVVGWPTRAAGEAVYYLAEPTRLPGYSEVCIWLQRPGNRVVCHGDAAYPETFRSVLPDAPWALYACGDATLLNREQLVIVGSRRATGPNRQLIENWACHLAASGLVITSGMAYGIDAAAHRGALAHAGGQSIGVMAGGLDAIFPRGNRTLARRLLEQGGLLVSEYPPWQSARPGQFPQRNRMVAALGQAVLVGEAAERSGSMITARLAAEYGRTVYVVTDHPFNRNAWGGLGLIRDGAEPVWRWQDCLPSLSVETRSGTGSKDTSGPVESAPTSALDAEESRLLRLITTVPVSHEQLSTSTSVPGDRLATLLLQLELKGCIRRTLGGFQRMQGL